MTLFPAISHHNVSYNRNWALVLPDLGPAHSNTYLPKPACRGEGRGRAILPWWCPRSVETRAIFPIWQSPVTSPGIIKYSFTSEFILGLLGYDWVQWGHSGLACVVWPWPASRPFPDKGLPGLLLGVPVGHVLVYGSSKASFFYSWRTQLRTFSVSVWVIKWWWDDIVEIHYWDTMPYSFQG